MEIIFESHATSEDNEKGLASGQLDTPLSSKGLHQATELGRRYKVLPDVILCSDLQRSYRTAELAFSGALIVRDSRLREWDYGNYNGRPAAEIDSLKSSYIETPFPDGESLQEAVARILFLLDEFLQSDIDSMLFIGHRATYYALEHRYNGRSLEDLVQAPWRWQPGWHYHSHIAQLIDAWQAYLQKLDWRSLADKIEARKSECGVVYELGSPLNRPHEDIAIVDMRAVHITQPHYHPQIEIYFLLQGSGRVVVGGKEKQLQKERAIVIPSNIAHYVIPENDLVIAVVSTPPFVLGASVTLAKDDPAVGFNQAQFDHSLRP